MSLPEFYILNRSTKNLTIENYICISFLKDSVCLKVYLLTYVFTYLLIFNRFSSLK